MATYYIAVTGSDINTGSIISPFATWGHLSSVMVAGDIAYIRGGTYRSTSGSGDKVLWDNLHGTAIDSIKIFAYPGETPILNLDNITTGTQATAMVHINNCDYLHVKGLRVTGAIQDVSGNVLWGMLLINVNNSVVENCTVDHVEGYGYALGAGEFGASGSNVLLLNCDAYACEDPHSSTPYGGSNGFSITGGLNTATNITLRGCRAWNNSDDGFDLYGLNGFITFENCWSFRNGYHEGTETLTGDGMGFKLGPTSANYATTHLRTVTNCLAVHNRNYGFDQNTNSFTSLMWLYNNLSYNNSDHGFFFGYGISAADIFRNNIEYKSLYGNTFDPDDVHDHNDWDSAITVTDADFISLDESQLFGARQADGSLPIITFGHLAAGSDLINAGVDVGLPYSGSAPDIGAFERQTIYYVATPANGGNDANGGTIGSPFATLQKLNDVLTAGDIAYVRGGTYTAATGDTWYQTRWHNLTGTATDTIKIYAYPGETPVFDYTGHNFGTSTSWLVQMYECDYIHVKGLTFTNATQPASSPILGFNLTNSSHNLIEFVILSHLGGFGFSVGSEGWGTGDLNTANSEYNTFLNCDAYDCSDPTSPSPFGGANGFNIVHNAGISNTYAPNTVFRNCRAWNNSDDGWDFFGSDSYPVTIDNCWSFWNGIQYGGTALTGDGNGFKLGPNLVNLATTHTSTLKNCIAAGNRSMGFDQNTTQYTSLMWLFNNLSYNNQSHGFFFGYGISAADIFRNNIEYKSLYGNTFDPDDVHDHNDWDSSITVTDADFVSLDESQLFGARQADGSLPIITFGHLATGSALINAGVNVGLPYSGSAPDIGAFEYVSNVIRFLTMNGKMILRNGKVVVQ